MSGRLLLLLLGCAAPMTGCVVDPVLRANRSGRQVYETREAFGDDRGAWHYDARGRDWLWDGKEWVIAE